MPRFPERWLEELKSKSDIVSILSKFMYIQRRGNKYWACCPFHNEKTPSFVINPEEQYYYCYGCHKSGNVITFLMEHERMTYADAVEWLAKEAHMEVPENDDPAFRERKQKFDKLVAVNRAAARYYYSCLKLKSATPVIAYMDRRGLKRETQVIFGLGYAPDGYGLINALSKEGFAKETMITAGLVNEDGYDPLAKRMIVPIINAKGQVVGFGGRTLEKDVKPKYRNTKGTPLFDKRKNLYNINLFKKTQAEEKHSSIVLTEGYMDVISLYQGGIHNVVASMGTALTPEQCKEMHKYVPLVYVCYDGDAAGQNATWRSLDLLVAEGLEVKVMSLPDGMDPDDTVKKLGVDGFKKLMSAALPLNEFKIRTLASKQNLETMEGREKFARSTIPVLASMDAISKETYSKLVSELSGLSTDSLLTSASAVAPEEAVLDVGARNRKAPETDANINVCRFILASAIELKEYVLLEDLKEEYFTSDIHKAVFKYLKERVELKDHPPRKGDLFDLVEGGEAEITELITSLDKISVDKQGEFYRACIERLEKSEREAERIRLVEALKTAEGEQKEILSQRLLSLINKK